MRLYGHIGFHCCDKYPRETGWGWGYSVISGVSPLGSTGSASMVRHDFTVGGWGLGAQPRCSPHGNQKAQGKVR